MSRSGRVLAALLATLSVTTAFSAPVAGAEGPAVPAAGEAEAGSLTPVSPTPQHLTRVGPDLVVPGRAEVVAGADTDGTARALLVRTLRAHGVEPADMTARASGRSPLTVLLGPATRPDLAAALTGTDVPDHAEGYALRVDRENGAHGMVALGGTDAAGQFYAVQTVRQLFVRTGDDTGDDEERIAGAGVSDHPSMPLRGTIEGFYGPLWTTAERLDHMASSAT
jgi:hyaluronoglucosaminidase